MLFYCEYRKKALQNYFSPDTAIERILKKNCKSDFLKNINALINQADFTYINQAEMLGLGHAILTARSFVGKEYFWRHITGHVLF